jgi:hypothetical protein
MAATERTAVFITHDKDHRVIGSMCVKWEGLDSDDTGAWVRVSNLRDKSIQMQGTLGTGGKMKVQGYNGANPADASAFGYLTYDGSTDIEMSAIGELFHIAEAVTWIRPIATAGDGSTSLTATMQAGG